MGGMATMSKFAAFALASLVDMRDHELRFEAEGPDLAAAFGHLPGRDGFTHPLDRRSRGAQAHRKRHRNRNHISRRTRRKHRRAA